MQAQKVTLVCNLKNTFVVKDIKLLESMGYQVLVIYSPAYRDPIRFLLNRVREFFLSLYYLPQSEALFSWFNDYHSSIPLFWARVFKKPATLIVGGYDAVASSKLNYGVFLKKNIRQKSARWNYSQATNIWVVHKSLAQGCPYAEKDSGVQSGIQFFIPELKTEIKEVPTAYDHTFWRAEKQKKLKTIITVASIPDQRTFVRKGVPLFLELARNLPDFLFTVAGIQNAAIPSEPIPKNVRLIGKQSREQLQKLYETHFYYFQGSEIEGLPNVLCEAMLCECIPIGKKVFGIPDAIGATGLIFDSERTIENITAFLKQENKGLAVKARKQIIDKYPLDRRQAAFKQTLIKSRRHV